MKIKLRVRGVRLTLLFPTALITCRPVFALLLRPARGYTALSKEQRKAAAKRLKLCFKKHRGLTLADVETREGETISIRL